MAVTPADIQRVSQKYMRNIRFVVSGESAECRYGSVYWQRRENKSVVLHRFAQVSFIELLIEASEAYALQRRPFVKLPLSK